MTKTISVCLSLVFLVSTTQSTYAASEWCVVNKMGSVMNCSVFIDPCKQQAAVIGGACVLRDTPAQQQSPPTQPPAYNPPPPPVEQDHQIDASSHDPTVELIRLQTCEFAAKEAAESAQDFATLMKYLNWFHGRVVNNEVSKKEQDETAQMVNEKFAKAKDAAWTKGESYRKAMMDKIPANATPADRQLQTSIALMVGQQVTNVWTAAATVGADNPDAPRERLERILRHNCEAGVY